MTDIDGRRIGLCFTCRHARRVETPRSTFWMCGLSATDPRFAKYPRLPVTACDGYRQVEHDEAAGESRGG